MKNTETNETSEIPDFINLLEDESEVNPININQVFEWIIDQDQETKLRVLDFTFNLSGLKSNKEAAKINNRTPAAESQYGKKHQLGHFKYSLIN